MSSFVRTCQYLGCNFGQLDGIAEAGHFATDARRCGGCGGHGLDHTVVYRFVASVEGQHIPVAIDENDSAVGFCDTGDFPDSCLSVVYILQFIFTKNAIERMIGKGQGSRFARSGLG